MPGLNFGRQSCSTGRFYLCSSNGWRGCCKVDPCSLSTCPVDDRGPDGASSAAASLPAATSSSLLRITITVSTSQQSTSETNSSITSTFTSLLSSSISTTASTTLPNMQTETQPPTQSPTLTNSPPASSPSSRTPFIVGIVIGILVLLGLITAFVLLRRRRRRKQAARLSSATLPSPAPPSYSSPSTLFAEFGGYFKRSSKQKSPPPPSYPSSPALFAPEARDKHMLDGTPVAELLGRPVSELQGSRPQGGVALPDGPTVGGTRLGELDGVVPGKSEVKPKMPPRPERMLGSEVPEGIGPSLLAKKGEGSPRVRSGEDAHGHVLSWSGVPAGVGRAEGQGLGIEGVERR
ncbi:MAG: hypothetical protein M1814_004001 [Vezdaea aestivalis]|nr:MAG: hypothetical protein M1814_004001 [Vezdaea aestivalis]